MSDAQLTDAELQSLIAFYGPGLFCAAPNQLGRDQVVSALSELAAARQQLAEAEAREQALREALAAQEGGAE